MLPIEEQHHRNMHPSHKVSKRNWEYVPSVSHNLPLVNMWSMFFLNLTATWRDANVKHTSNIMGSMVDFYKQLLNCKLKVCRAEAIHVRNPGDEECFIMGISQCCQGPKMDIIGVVLARAWLQPSYRASSVVQD